MIVFSMFIRLFVSFRIRAVFLFSLIVIFDLVVVFPPRAIRVNAMNKEST